MSRFDDINKSGVPRLTRSVIAALDVRDIDPLGVNPPPYLNGALLGGGIKWEMERSPWFRILRNAFGAFGEVLYICKGKVENKAAGAFQAAPKKSF